MRSTDHLARLDAALVGPAAVRRSLLREATDHLEDAREAYVAAGYEPDEADALAVRDFGSVDEVAAAFQTTLAVAASRRTAGLLLAVLALQPFAWDGGLFGLLSVEPASSPGGLYTLLDTGVEIGGSFVLLTALAMLVAAGLGNRWRHAGRGVARFTGWFAVASAAGLPLTGLAMVLLATPADPAAWAMLSVLMLGPMGLVGLWGRRTLATC